LDHDRSSVADVSAEDFRGDPSFVGVREVGGGAVEHLHLSGGEDCYYVEVSGGSGVVEVEVYVGLDERGPGLEDCGGAGDHGFEGEGAGFGIALGLLLSVLVPTARERRREGVGEEKEVKNLPPTNSHPNSSPQPQSLNHQSAQIPDTPQTDSEHQARDNSASQ